MSIVCRSAVPGGELCRPAVVYGSPEQAPGRWCNGRERDRHTLTRISLRMVAGRLAGGGRNAGRAIPLGVAVGEAGQSSMADRVQVEVAKRATLPRNENRGSEPPGIVCKVTRC